MTQLIHREIRIDLPTLFKALCTDLDIHVSIVNYCLSRFNHEGIAFFTKTLPKLGSMVLEAVEFNSLPLMIKKYTNFRWKSGAPLHFKRLTDLIFDTNGSVRVDVDPTYIYVIRQFSQYMYKLALAYTDEQLASAEDSFVKVEAELANDDFDVDFVDRIRKNIESTYSFPTKDFVLKTNRPRMGPGTFSGKKNAEHSSNLEWYRYKVSADVLNTTLSKYNSISGFFKPYPSEQERTALIKHDTSYHSELLFVPKDSRGPRTIMREPLHALKLQMSFFDWFSGFLQKNSKGRINFTDQTVNRRLAEQGSISGSWATIDLKEASDRVSYAVIKRLAVNIPVLHWYLKHSRTPTVQLPSGKVMNLSKLAGMGSGLTFVWLSFLIHAAVATEISIKTGTSYGAASRHVYTYGDDLIVPVCYVEEAKRALKKVSLVINNEKSFYRRSYSLTKCFRESCGGDYYGGSDVSIARLKLQNCSLQVAKRILKVSGTQAIVMVSEHAGEVSLQGLNSVSKYLYGELEKCTGPLPLMNRKGVAIGRLTRSYVSYPTDKTGTYIPLKVICAVPVLLETPEQHSSYKIAEALQPSVVDDFAFLDGDSTPSIQYELAVPRMVAYARKTISSFSLMR